MLAPTPLEILDLPLRLKDPTLKFFLGLAQTKGSVSLTKTEGTKCPGQRAPGLSQTKVKT